ncbi:MAG TPA: copper resistance protein CopC [Dehalococcoidia bacterium]|nr:copper resistance protein CopC [Dehalococcoidia bacterium]
MKTRTVLAATVSALLYLMLPAVMAPTAALAEPKLTEASPSYGDVLEAIPEFLHLCFSEPVQVDDTGDWKFNVKTPEGQALGIRIVFEPSGGCVDVYPGVTEEPPQGIWTFDWLVRAQSDGSEGSGAIKFQMGELQPGETPLDKADSSLKPSDQDDGAPTGLVVAIGIGAALIIIATGGFILSRRRGPHARSGP